MSERWQLEIAETVFDVVNAEADRVDNKRHRHRQNTASTSNAAPACTSSPTSLSVPLQRLHTSSPDMLANSIEVLAGSPPTAADTTGAPAVSGAASTSALGSDECHSDCIVEGEVLRLVGPFFQTWQRKHLRLFPNRLEMHSKCRDGSVSLKGVEVG